MDDNLRSKLEDGETIEHAAVKGDVYAENQVLKGKFCPDTSGVVSVVTTREYRRKFSLISGLGLVFVR